MQRTLLFFIFPAVLSAAEPEIINGYLLPPEPDPKINNSTLLGIDANNNGVRDDVERWVIKKYRDEHKIVTEIALQAGRASQIIIQEPSKAQETMKYMDEATYCESYFKRFAKYKNEPILVHEDISDRRYDSVQFNTKERINAYFIYNATLGGGVYGTPTIAERRAMCDFDVDALLKE